MMTIEVNGSRPNDPLNPAVVAEFEVLLMLLDSSCIRRHEWERLKSILVVATLEANNAEDGQEGYARAMAKWRMSRWFDGAD